MVIDALSAPNTAVSPGARITRQSESLPNEGLRRQHILTVGLEDWFQVGAFQQLINYEHWYRFETRLERSTRATLELLDRHDTKATFFVLGWVAHEMPELVKEVAARGHEIASRGFYHRSVHSLTREEFRDDLLRTQEALVAATGQRIRGYRVADGWLRPEDLWALDVLAEEGYAYDSSLLPLGFRFRDEPWRRFVHAHKTPAGPLTEVPPSSVRLAGCCLPISGGNWFRQIPHTLLKHFVSRWDRRSEHPLVTYFHTWELDPEQPRISAVDRLNRVRHYRNLDKMRWVLAEHLSQYRFGTVAESLGLGIERVDEPAPTVSRIPSISPSSSFPASRPAGAASRTSSRATPVSVVIPCYNEESTLPYLARTLERLEFELQGAGYEPQFVFVDDRSSDTTWETMHSVFGNRSNVRLVRHEQNAGVSAAIRTGIANADHEVVCSMDCDCSYDPLELTRMIPLLTDGVDLVTASPYHPQGHVKNVPGWRLLLSKGLSTLYRLVLPQKLHTWTSCFRVYRRSAVTELSLQENGFLGTAELVGRLSQAGGRIVEHPATLEVRIFGESKMKTCRTIVGHLRLIARLIRERGSVPASPDRSSEK
jgi:polysaccharide deacetylase family protein (PEP-CTERM system associated)